LFVEGARQHNLKHITVRIPHDQLTVITGVSGSGKSSLAFDTIFAEGQWRYLESLSTYARLFLEKMDRPDVDRILNLRPAIAIEPKNPVRTARSTVGTATEVADLLRLLFAKIGKWVCPACQHEARSDHPGSVADDLLARYPNGRAMILFRVNTLEPGREHALIDSLLARGFVRVKCGEEVLALQPGLALPRPQGADLYVVLDRVVIRPDTRNRIVEAVETAFREGEGLCHVDVVGHKRLSYSRTLRCPSCHRSFEPPRPVLFSFNHPLGACPTCKGFGNLLRYDEDLIIPDKQRSLADGAVEPWTRPWTKWWQTQMLLGMKRKGVDLTVPYAKLSEEERRLLWDGDRTFEGIRDFFAYLEQKRYKLHIRVFLSRYRSPDPCPACRGSRLRPEALTVKVAGQDIHQVSALPLHQLAEWVDRLVLSPFEAEIAGDVLERLRTKLGLLIRVGLGYLTLSRQMNTLSGGEAQRILLAKQLGAHLVGTLYVLDEPTIGLHARDIATLTSILRDLAHAGNTVVVVEHDRQVIQAADHVIELGPRSGEAGGYVIASHPREQFLAHPHSLTARYLRGEEAIPLPRTRRPGLGRFITLTGAREHNLKDLHVRFPLGMLICVTGVSGSGKSTLVEKTLYRAVARALGHSTGPVGQFSTISGVEHVTAVRLIDQEPIGRTPRSNPITYLDAFAHIRALFASTPEAKAHGLSRAHFSFNLPSGRCERCQGMGYEKLEMYFFEDVYATCEACHGRRFSPAVLKVRYRGKTVDEVLNLTVDEALTFFADSPRLSETLHLMASIGLGYLRLGQPANTLSGGEAQRLKIAAALQDQHAGSVLYIMDEPTTGLHLHDIKTLLVVLNRLVDAGHTVVAVEHNLEFIKAADWIIDLGPEGGEQGGQIVAEGRPEHVAQVSASHTGQLLRPLLAG
jgi:excinuclease ABC subunit A